MFSKILIANRGEIAVRIIRACREMGIETVVVYSEADKEALHVQMADEAVCIGPAAAKDSYLNMVNIISAAVLKGAQAIHPGFGFLSENSRFAEICENCSIAFIGPDADTISKMGNKSNAREMMKKAAIPVIPGSEGIISSACEGLREAEKIGYPVMIKASSGGGGRGIRIVKCKEEFENAFETAKIEAESAFGDGSVYIEKYIENPRHIEFQILGDSYDNIVYLGERDCSIQRRNQKILEEAPSPVLNKKLREEMGEAAVLAARTVNYKGAGTVEFLLDKDGSYYFMEMNTRIQVEHPVTEMITGIDIVKEQIKIAANEKLKLMQDNIKINGHAIECRINAEDPSCDFRPSPGKILSIYVPGGPGVRFDGAVYEGYTIPPYYDSMIGKLIVWGKDRDEAIMRMRRALGEFVIEGIKNNIDYELLILENKNFIDGRYDTGFLESQCKLV